jgi:general secretion pathway protein A
MYDQFYELQGRPFQLTPDPHFYFESATHRKALSYLGYGLAQGEGFIVITGDIGAGKTTLVGHLMATIDPARLTAVKIVSTQVGGDDMLRLAAQNFGISSDGVPKAQLLQQIEGFLHAQARKGLRTLLIVDEAQNMAVTALEELRMLSNFQLGGQALLQIFLLGQPEFRDLLKSADLEQLRQRVIATHHLEPMLSSEVEPYIMHRLSLVGWKGNPGFSADAFLAVFNATDGVPRRVNALMSRVLLLGAIDRLGQIDAGVVQAVAADMSADAHAEPEQPEAVAAVPDDALPEPAPAALSSFSPAEAVPEMTELHSTSDLYELHQIRAEIDEMRRALAVTARTDTSEEIGRHLTAIEQRLAAAEARGEEQDAALRRVLTLLVEWVETDAQGIRAA